MGQFNLLTTLVCLVIIAYIIYKCYNAAKYPIYENFQSVSKAMIIVEPRKHKLLKTVIANFDNRMDASWDLYVFHGRQNKTEAKEAINNINKRNVFLKELDYDNISADEYNELFKDEDFWNQINAEHILVFQTDAVTCSKSTHSIDEFLQYGYIGCSANNEIIGVHPNSPWYSGPDTWLNKSKMKDYSFYGIGGLSLRKKSFMLKCIKRMPYPKTFPEDVYYSECVKEFEDASLRPESANTLMNFCAQYSYSPDNKSWGAHKTNASIPLSDPFYEYCPEAKVLFE